MPSPISLSVDKLSRLVGRPDTPDLIDVRDDAAFAADPRLVSGSRRRPAEGVAGWAVDYRDRPGVVLCRQGAKLSEGVAAWLRHEAATAETLEGGHAAWAAAGLPLVPKAALPARDAAGRTVWVTRARDLAQLEAGMLLYDALFRWCRDATGEMHNWPAAKPAGASA